MSRCVQQIEFRTLVGNFSGSAAAIYPKSVRIAQIKFPLNYALVGIQLSSSLVIFGSNRGGILVVIGQQPKIISVSDSINSPLSHITQPNSITGTPNIPIPTSKVTSHSFGAYAVAIRAGTPISLYAFADATADNDLFAICSLQLAQVI